MKTLTALVEVSALIGLLVLLAQVFLMPRQHGAFRRPKRKSKGKKHV